ncbi:hypothetical protein ACVXG7_30780 [Enterobacter hormaechei]
MAWPGNDFIEYPPGGDKKPMQGRAEIQARRLKLRADAGRGADAENPR